MHVILVILIPQIEIWLGEYCNFGNVPIFNYISCKIYQRLNDLTNSHFFVQTFHTKRWFPLTHTHTTHTHTHTHPYIHFHTRQFISLVIHFDMKYSTISGWSTFMKVLIKNFLPCFPFNSFKFLTSFSYSLLVLLCAID